MNKSLKHINLRGLLVAACIISLAMLPFSVGTALAAAVNYEPVLTATPVSGTAPLTVNFTRSVTTDPNGPIISHVALNYGDSNPGISGTLDFGDGTPTFTLNQTSSHTYILSGVYFANLTVFYVDNTSVTTTLIITVNPSVIPEQLPLITASPSSGTAPLTVALASSATMNPNGPLINSYQVDYGDGTSNQFILNAGNSVTSFTGTSSHVYTTAGTYTATLTVTYNNAVSASATTTIIVNPAVSTVLRSTAINLSATLQKNKVNATGTVIVQDSNGVAISGAVVAVTWTKPGGGTVTQTVTTNSNGIAKFNTSGNRGTYTLTVKNLRKTGYSFDSVNSILSKSITK
jgi:PKD repeat protein